MTEIFDFKQKLQSKEIEELYGKFEMFTPKDYIGPLMDLAQYHRREFYGMKFITENRALITC